ncbi:MAG: hypothetical protein N2253_04585 [Bacteroidia bacterium]|nr:hypothetical protein [Bacteroidia bacterium]
MSWALLVLGQIAASLPWGDVRSRAFWQLYGAELRKTSAYNAPYAYTLLLNGADVRGLPYQADNPQLRGFADSAVCGCIRMDSVGPAYLSFAYQRGGRMDAPEADDTLMLWGLNAQGEWVPLWQIQGTGMSETTFTSVTLFLSEPQWLHPCFRLKWTAWGSTYGAYDNWHIAYTIINRDSSASLPAYVRLPRIYDKVYGTWGLSYVPQDSVLAVVRGDLGSDTEVEVRLLGQSIFRKRLSSGGMQETIWVRIPPVPLPGSHPIVWILKWGSLLQDSLVFPDTLRLEESVWGYDDGEMEAGYGLLQANRPFYQEFQLDSAYRISRVGVRFFAVPTQYGKPFQLGIWDAAGGNRLLYLKYERISGDSVEKWQWFRIDTPLIVQGKVGVGFIQADGQPLAVGWDANCTAAVFVEGYRGWTPSQIVGCMMLRIELLREASALEMAKASAGERVKVLRIGERLTFPEGWVFPGAIWSMEGRLIQRLEREDIVFWSPGVYICTDGVGRVLRLHVIP